MRNGIYGHDAESAKGKVNRQPVQMASKGTRCVENILDPVQVLEIADQDEIFMPNNLPPNL